MAADTPEGVVEALLDVMTMQERRETGEFHVSQIQMSAMWERAKMRAERYLDQRRKEKMT
jgi:uncharacterized SAM-dependent methyltransferase